MDAKGICFENRFKCRRVKSDSHLRSVLRYVDMNPVQAGMRERPEDWEWSSYRAHAGLAHPEPFLDNAQFLTFFARSPELAYERYRRFVGLSQPELVV